MTVITAQNGEEAIQKATLEKPDLIITDIQMPKKSGFEVCKHIRPRLTFKYPDYYIVRH